MKQFLFILTLIFISTDVLASSIENCSSSLQALMTRRIGYARVKIDYIIDLISEQNGSFPIVTGYNYHDLPENAPISSIVSKDGGIFLFRLIRGKYNPKYNYKNSYYASRNGRYSYSFSPYITRFWRQGISADSEIIISYHNVLNENLTFPASIEWRLDHGLPVVGPVNPRVSLDTKRSDFAALWEIEVLVTNENPVLVIPLTEFLTILERFKDKPIFKLQDFLSEIYWN